MLRFAQHDKLGKRGCFTALRSVQHDKTGHAERSFLSFHELYFVMPNLLFCHSEHTFFVILSQSEESISEFLIVSTT